MLKSGENCTRVAAARKPATLPAIGSLSAVLLTIGPIPKLTNKDPHRGKKSRDQTHLRRTGPASNQSNMTDMHAAVTWCKTHCHMMALGMLGNMASCVTSCAGGMQGWSAAAQPHSYTLVVETPVANSRRHANSKITFSSLTPTQGNVDVSPEGGSLRE